MPNTLIVRVCQAEDWADVYEIYANRRVIRQTFRLPYVRPEAVREEIAGTEYMLVAEITLPGGNMKIVGVLDLQLNQRYRRKHVAKLNLAIHPGYATPEVGGALLSALVDLADNWLGLRRVQAEIFADDTSLAALYEGFGFESEAILRRGALRDGGFADVRMVARINEKLGGRRKTTGSPTGLLGRPRSAERPEITVRGRKLDDYEAMHEIFTTPPVYMNTMGVPYRSLDATREMVENPREGFYPLIAEVEGRAVGLSGLHFKQGRQAHVAGVGMMVHPDYHGVGVGTALMRAVIDMAEGWSQIRRLELEVYPDNPNAIALYEKFDFEREGRMRDYSFQNGFYIDALVMSRLCD